MNTLILYDSAFGNTERIARALAERLGSARVMRITEMTDPAHIECKLLIVAGPTQRHGMSPVMRAWFEQVPRGTLKHMSAATFDTRYRMARFLSGSAAVQIAARLRHAGARLVAPPESFFIERDVPPEGEKRRHALEQPEPGEEERAAQWAMYILAQLDAPRAATNGNINRWLYRGGRPHRIARVINRAWATLASMGIAPNYLVTLEVVGRRSGRTISLPVVVAVIGGQRYLVSMLGDNVQWVQNVHAAAGRAALRSAGLEKVHLEEVPSEERAPILKIYLRRAPGARPHIPVSKDAPLAEFEKVAADYPVFRILKDTPVSSEA